MVASWAGLGLDGDGVKYSEGIGAGAAHLSVLLVVGVVGGVVGCRGIRGG